jgi:anti-anti-sigma factor
MQVNLLSAEGGITRLECAGEITQTALWNNPNPFEEKLGEKGFAGKVVVSLLKTDYIDSAGVGLFISCQRKSKEAGGMLVLHSIPPLVKHIFQFLKMDQVLHLAKDEDAALVLVQRSQP